MSHTVRIQKLRYDTIESEFRLKKGADIISRESRQVLGFTENNSSEETFLPLAGEVVAFIDAKSTSTRPIIYLGKVIGFDADLTNAIMVKLVQTGDPRLYKIEIGSRFEKGLQSIVHPIDVQYDERENAYELRTSPSEIHKYVMSNRSLSSSTEEQ